MSFAQGHPPARAQALVEFDTPAAAAHAITLLNGHDLFPGCCTLRAEYSTAEFLTVKSNSADARDFSLPGAFEVAGVLPFFLAR